MKRTRLTHRMTALVVAVLATVATVVSACSADSTQTEDGKVVFRYQGQNSAVRWFELADALGYFSKIKLKWVGDTTSGPQDIQSVATNQVEVGGAFNGSVASLQQAGAPLVALVSEVGSDDKTFQGYYSLEGSGINGPRDLIGKKVAINTLGAYHEYVLREWLYRNKLSSDEINSIQLTVVPPINTEQALRTRQVEVGNLGTIFKDAALANGGLHEVFRDTDLDGPLALSTTVVRKDFLEHNKEAVADFVQGYARAVRWAQLHTPQEVIAKFTEIINKRGRNENTKFVSQWKSAGLKAPGGVIAPLEFQRWVDVGVRIGKIKPGIDVSSLYTNDLNPYANGTFAPDSDENGKPITKQNPR